MADVEIDQDTLDWMRCTYKEARSKTKAIPILAQCTGLTHAQVRAALGLHAAARGHHGVGRPCNRQRLGQAGPRGGTP